MDSYRELIVWQKSMDLVEEVYRLVKRLPKEEMHALGDQIRRAVVSIPSNIAEGQGRGTAKEYVHFLSIARGSKYEVETQLMICERLGYMKAEEMQQALSYCAEIGKMINAMIRRLRE